MKRQHYLFFTLLLIIMSFSFNTKSSAAKTLFKDVPTHHYAYDAIKWAYDFDIIGGYPDGTFRPNQPVTEQQFAKILVTYFDLEPVSEELNKFTKREIASDHYYNTLAAYQTPLNGYFDNDIRGRAVSRGVVAQAITHVADGNATLKQSIQFLLDHSISSGQNPKYEYTNLAKYFGASNNLTRAQVVAFFHNLQNKNYFYISEDAESSYENLDNLPLNVRANAARKTVDASLRIGKDWSTVSKENSWDGNYFYYYKYGRGEADSSLRDLTISFTSKKDFYVEYETYDGYATGFVQGYATVISNKKAMLSETIAGERCVIEFQKLNNNTIKTIEHDCDGSRQRETNFNGILKLK
ncbi:S-layer homology domain-containing protein [Solibacillus sp. FSL K6-1523]|uniref:S-layer homology domain-containing protein n=1 Tax=Solibacillus sp. FSL K6-1523 TaxID=2921471 RepID=UPI0030F6B884